MDGAKKQFRGLGLQYLGRYHTLCAALILKTSRVRRNSIAAAMVGKLIR